MSKPDPIRTPPASAPSSAAAAGSDAPRAAPSSPEGASLFAQLQAAQNSSGGTAAAAAILLAKSKELLGMSEAASSSSSSSSSGAPSLVESAGALVHLDPETQARLAREGEELRGFSEMLLASEGGHAVSNVWSQLAEKYSESGSGLQNEALNLWTQLYTSSEASEISSTSAELLDAWKAYAATHDGQELLAQSAQMLQAQSGALGSLLASVTLGGAADAALGVGASASAPAPSVSPTNADSSPSARSSRLSHSSSAELDVPSSAGGAAARGSATPSPSPQPASAGGLHKEALMKTTTKVTAALADDEDVKELLTRGGALLKSFGGHEESGAAGAKSASPASSPAKGAVSPASSTHSATGAADESTAGAVAGSLMSTGESYLKSLRESDTGHKLLAKASVMLQQNKDLLRPENLSSLTGNLMHDTAARESFITRVKDMALDFLLSYLPTVVVPPVCGEKDSIAYKVENIDLGGFAVDSNHVLVTLAGDSIEVRATHISCAMKNLLWSYKKTSFPRISGSGTADAQADDVDFVLRLKLAYPPTPEQEAAAAAAAKGKGTKGKAGAPAPTAASSASASSAAGSKERTASVAQLAAGAKDAVAKKAAPASSSSSSSADTLAVPAAGSAAAASSSTHSASASASGSSTPPSPSSRSSRASPAAQSFLATVSTDLGQPRLVMSSCSLRLKTFKISIHSGWGKSIYNKLLALFNESVKGYIEASLNAELQSKSVYLLETINEMSQEYLPLLQRILVKGTKAAMAEDDDAGGGSATVVSRSGTGSAQPSPSSSQTRPMDSGTPPLHEAQP